jgi:hypothetical protein
VARFLRLPAGVPKALDPSLRPTPSLSRRGWSASQHAFCDLSIRGLLPADQLGGLHSEGFGKLADVVYPGAALPVATLEAADVVRGALRTTRTRAGSGSRSKSTERH